MAEDAKKVPQRFKDAYTALTFRNWRQYEYYVIALLDSQAETIRRHSAATHYTRKAARDVMSAHGAMIALMDDLTNGQASVFEALESIRTLDNADSEEYGTPAHPAKHVYDEVWRTLCELIDN